MDDINSRIQGIDAIIQENLLKSKIPGLAVGVMHDNHLTFFKGYGYANIAEKKPVDAHTVFRLASISKIFTTIGLLQQWEKNKFDLDDPVNHYLPKSQLIPKEKQWPSITFRHLLTHQSGIGELVQKSDIFKHGFGLNIKWPKSVPPLSYLHDHNVITTIPAGQKYAYSNYGFSLLGYLLEILSGEDFPTYMQNHIFEPLEMNASDFIRSKKIQAQEAQGYVYQWKKYKPATYWQSIIRPAGGLYSTVEDMAKLAQVFLNKGMISTGHLLKPETLELAWTPQYYAHPAFKTYQAMGLCFHLYEIQGHRVIEHQGITSGFTRTFTLIPDFNLGFLVFSNLDEIFRLDYAIKIKNFILQHLLQIQTPKLGSIPLDRTIWSKLPGYYGPIPGVLTNTRILMSAGDYKVQIKKNVLTLSSLYGPLRKGKQLFPTDDPFLFDYIPKPGTHIHITNRVGFEINEIGDITHLTPSFSVSEKIALFRPFGLNFIV